MLLIIEVIVVKDIFLIILEGFLFDFVIILFYIGKVYNKCIVIVEILFFYIIYCNKIILLYYNLDKYYNDYLYLFICNV